MKATSLQTIALLLPTLCFGKVVEMDLCEITARSDVITLATMPKCETRNNNELCRLSEHQDFKGAASEAICTDVSSVEARPLSRLGGTQVMLFLHRAKGCLTATGANRGVVAVEGTVAYTVSIRDLAERTELPELIGKLRECIGK